MVKKGPRQLLACFALFASAIATGTTGCASAPGAATHPIAKSAGLSPHDEALAIACEAGDALSCGRLGNVFLRADGKQHDLGRAEAYHHKACDLGLPASCTAWGALLATRAPAQAFPIFEKACAAGHVVGCYDEGRALYTGQGVAKDVDRAVKLIVGACESGHPSACALAGSASMLGAGLPKDEAKAALYLSRACESDPSSVARADGSPAPSMGDSCAAAAKLLEGRAKTEHEKRRVATMLERACDLGYLVACNDAGSTFVELGTEADKAHGTKLVAAACDRGDVSGCGNMGIFLMQTDPFTAAQYLTKACDGKNGQSCANLAFLYAHGTGVLVDLAKAVHLTERACELGNMPGCLFAGGSYYEGKAVKEDRARARTYLEKACDGGVGNACAALARMYEYALGVDEDMTRARTYHRRACDAGNAEQCARSDVTAKRAAK